jgi:hypothetical protein
MVLTDLFCRRLMLHYRVRQEMSETGREAQRNNVQRLGYILEKTSQIKAKHIKIVDAATGLARVRSSSKQDQEYHVDLERMVCDCPASDDTICAHMRAVARACGGEARYHDASQFMLFLWS